MRTTAIATQAAITAAIAGAAALLGQPASAQPMDKLLAAHSEFSIFTNALRKSGLWEQIQTRDGMTIFAISDEAMSDEGSTFLLDKVLITKSNQERLFNLMSFHVLFGTTLDPESIDGEVKLDTAEDSCLSVWRMGTAVRVGPEAVVTSYMSADNGVVFVIDRLLWQPWDDHRSCAELL
jgi:uncharacterized surface protein with fasciclin (FAS1) repeats